jgi:hypothetical protein
MESRQTRENISYEIGYYKVSMQRGEEAPRHYYGRFHVVIKKINGQGKKAEGLFPLPLCKPIVKKSRYRQLSSLRMTFLISQTFLSSYI